MSTGYPADKRPKAKVNIRVHKIEPSGFASNSYILTSDGRRAVVIDCAQERVYDECAHLGLEPVAVLLTHGHYDHIGGCVRFAENGVPIYMSAEEHAHVFSPEYTALAFGKVKEFPVSGTFSDGDDISFAGIKFKAIATPGHTRGGMCYLADKHLFTGDTLFRESIGRSDLPTGNFSQLAESVRKLYALDGDYTVYCGHEENTTLEHERKYNPYVRQKNA